MPQLGISNSLVPAVPNLSAAGWPKETTKISLTVLALRGGNKMKPSTDNEIAGKVHEVKGKTKEKVGRLTNDPDLEAEGIGEKIGGKVQKKSAK